MAEEDKNNGELQKRGGPESIVDQGQGFNNVYAQGAIDHFAQFVCQILVARKNGTGNDVRGTGFLIGTKYVLTNFHVVEGCRSSELSCRFDVKRYALGGVSLGPDISVTNILAKSRYSEMEANGSYTYGTKKQPSADELDYAVLELKEKIGCQNIEVNRKVHLKRGWLELPSDQPDVDQESNVSILQHPRGGPMQVAEGELDPYQPSSGTRIRYQTNTQNGSSGSPCFRLKNGSEDEMSLVALHNYGDPGWQGEQSAFNHGIPIELIARDLTRKRVRLTNYCFSTIIYTTAAGLLLVLFSIFFVVLLNPCFFGIGCEKPKEITQCYEKDRFYCVYYEEKNGLTTKQGQLRPVDGVTLPRFSDLQSGMRLKPKSQVNLRRGPGKGFEEGKMTVRRGCFEVIDLIKELTKAQRGNSTSAGWLKVKTCEDDVNLLPWNQNEIACSIIPKYKQTPSLLPTPLSGSWCGRWWDAVNKQWIAGTSYISHDIKNDSLIIEHNTGYNYKIHANYVSKYGHYKGKLVETNDPTNGLQNSEWIGVLKEDNQINGIWSGGRWDFRR